MDAPDAPEPASAGSPRPVVALDPGRNLGVAWLDAHGRLERLVVTDLSALGALELEGRAVALGDGTGSRAVQEALRRRGVAFELVDEEGSSLEGRELWRAVRPPRGLGRLMPRGLRAPGEPLDAYAAWAIARRWWRGRGLEPPPPAPPDG